MSQRATWVTRSQPMLPDGDWKASGPTSPAGMGATVVDGATPVVAVEAVASVVLVSGGGDIGAHLMRLSTQVAAEEGPDPLPAVSGGVESVRRPVDREEGVAGAFVRVELEVLAAGLQRFGHHRDVVGCRTLVVG